MEKRLGFESLNDEIFQSQFKAKYKSKIFIGSYTEKRLCEQLKCYRDIVYIDDSEIRSDFDKLTEELKQQYSTNNVFVGIAKTDGTYFQIWTELEDGMHFGKFWFQIKTIKFRFNEIQIKLKKLRSIDDRDSKTFSEKLRETTKADPQVKGDSSNEDDALEQWRRLYDFWKREIAATVAWFLSISVNRQTVSDTLKFISLLIVSLFAGSTQIVKYIGIFVIKLIEKTTWLVHVLTPIALGLMELISKIIGGFYLLVAMIWKDSVGGRKPQNAIEAGPRQRQQEAIRYNNY